MADAWGNAPFPPAPRPEGDEDELAAFLAGVPARTEKFPDNWISAADRPIEDEPAVEARLFEAWTD